MSAGQHPDAVDAFIEHERMVGMPANGEALLVRQAGLLESLFDMPVRQRLETAVARVEAMRHGDNFVESEAALMAALRREKAALHLLIALGDLSGAYFAADAEIDSGDASLEAEALHRMLEIYYEHSVSNNPVAEWAL